MNIRVWVVSLIVVTTLSPGLDIAAKCWITSCAWRYSKTAYEVSIVLQSVLGSRKLHEIKPVV